MPGHDINYISTSGVLAAIGQKGQAPVPPLNLIGDFGGGGLLLAFGLLAAVIETRRSGQGQVVDASMVDGSAILMSSIYGMFASGWWTQERGANVLDGGAPYYGVYQTADGGHISVGAVEDTFYLAFLEGLGQDPALLPPRSDTAAWDDLRKRLAKVIASKTGDLWWEFFEHRDACVAPVLSMSEAIDDKHNRHRGTFIEVDGVIQPAPAPRFSRTTPTPPGSAPAPGAHARDVLKALGLADAEIDGLVARHVIGA
jgi:alpha-methylacyl-CoA racemase